MGVKFKNLDYVAGWTIKGAQYCAAAGAQCAFVATNSICQGEQVGLLWPKVYECGVEIGFAHTSFKWKNNAANNAGVTCAIVGLPG
ncbi:DNA methyltransferase [Cupriavidus basilensis]